MLNFCADRYLALVGFAAALSRGQVTLLSADRPAGRLADIAPTLLTLAGLAVPAEMTGKSLVELKK